VIEALDLLRTGEIEISARMPYSSNATFLVEICTREARRRAIYKPTRGERPLWDFPAGLGRRETAAFEVSQALGWDLVPPTVWRDDGPFQEGSLQLFVDADFEQHYFTLRDDAALRPSLKRLCAFDIVTNSTDRKSGHCLVDDDRHLWAIDNGLSFHCEFKVRTVIWDFAEEPLPDDVTDALGALVARGLPPSLGPLLDDDERAAVLGRAGTLLDAGRFPSDPTGRRYPWPLV